MNIQLETPSSSGSCLRAIRLPWETLTQIYSYCDSPTLVSLSLVSFGSWETAGPFLYERVEVTSLNQLHSLFWLDEQPPSDRLWDSRPLLTRIWSLTINIKDVNERFRPGAYIDVEPDYDRYPDDPYARSEDGWSVDNEDCSGPKRLLREPWVLPHLTYISDASICTGDGGEDSLLGFFVSRVFPHLDPRQFIPRSAPSKTWADHVLMEVQRAFVHNWDALTCIEMDGLSLSACAPGDHDDDDGLDRQACPI